MFNANFSVLQNLSWRPFSHNERLIHCIKIAHAVRQKTRDKILFFEQTPFQQLGLEVLHLQHSLHIPILYSGTFYSDTGMGSITFWGEVSFVQDFLKCKQNCFREVCIHVVYRNRRVRFYDTMVYHITDKSTASTVGVKFPK